MNTFYFHIILYVADKHSLISPALEEGLYKNIRQKIHEMGLTFMAVNGMPDHIHIALAAHPKISMAEIISGLQEGISHWMDAYGGLQSPFKWSDMDFSESFSHHGLDDILHYVHHQKELHKNKTALQELADNVNVEEIIEEGGHLPREIPYDCPEDYGKNYVPLGADPNLPKISGGIFTDEGDYVDPEEIIVPSQCMLCRRYFAEDELDLIECQLMWADYKPGDDFQCGDFKPL